MMHPKGRERCQSVPPDFLSNLPDSLVDVIQMCLPCKDAIRTSILSKKWRYNWCRRTELELHVYNVHPKEDPLYPTLKLTKIINQLLTYHEGPITKFTLYLLRSITCPNIDNFLEFLSRNGIQHLSLRFPDPPYNLPSSLFTCLQLRHLSLSNCLIHPPSAFQGFDRLIKLTLCCVTISSELLESLISHCSLLEQLVLKLKILNIIEVNAPMLRYFYFSGNISSICLKNVPLLAKVSLRADYMDAENLDFAKLFASRSSSLEHLTLDLFHAEFLADEAPTRLSFDLNCVKHFYLPRIMLVESYKLSCALCLIRSFPSLEYLEIEVDNEEDDGYIESLALERFSDVTFSHLKEVKLKSLIRLTMPEMQLIALLLAKSPVLVRVVVGPWVHDVPLDPRLEVEVLPKLSKFPRASPQAEVVFCY